MLCKLFQIRQYSGNNGAISVANRDGALFLVTEIRIRSLTQSISDHFIRVASGFTRNTLSTRVKQIDCDRTFLKTFNNFLHKHPCHLQTSESLGFSGGVLI